MWKSMFRSSLVAFAFLGASFNAQTVHGDGATANDVFSGEWSVSAEPDSDAAADGQGKFDEAVLFHDGQFSAAAFAMYGFTPAAYTVEGSEGPPTFTATLASSGQGTLVWTGTTSATGLTGTLTWTLDDGHVYHYDLTGERQ